MTRPLDPKVTSSSDCKRNLPFTVNSDSESGKNSLKEKVQVKSLQFFIYISFFFIVSNWFSSLFSLVVLFFGVFFFISYNFLFVFVVIYNILSSDYKYHYLIYNFYHFLRFFPFFIIYVFSSFIYNFLLFFFSFVRDPNAFF